MVFSVASSLLQRVINKKNIVQVHELASKAASEVGVVGGGVLHTVIYVICCYYHLLLQLLLLLLLVVSTCKHENIFGGVHIGHFMSF